MTETAQMTQLHIFDIDGTVLDSMRMWDGLVPGYLKSKGIRPPEGIAEIIDPLTVPQVFEYVADRFPAAGDPETVKTELTALIRQQYAENAPPFEDAVAELKTLKAEGQRLMAFSNTPHEFIDFAIKQNKLDVYFSAIFTVEDVGERKDSARAFTKLCESLQIMPEEAVVHDDSAFAIEAAKAAGCRVEVYDRYRGMKARGRKEKRMKVLMINGSPKTDGNTALLLDTMTEEFAAAGIKTEVVQVGNRDIRGCTGCRKCVEKGSCIFDDIVNETAGKLAEADGMVIASPVYYASPNGTIISFLDRLFYSTGSISKTMKVGASVAVARRSGTTATYDVLNKYFGIAGMPIASSNYWNNAHGAAPGEAAGDDEGLQTMRMLARNMSFLMKSIALGKEKYGLPEAEGKIATNFIR